MGGNEGRETALNSKCHRPEDKRTRRRRIARGIVLRDAKERRGEERGGEKRTPPARGKYQESRVHHVSALSPGLRSSARGKTRPKLFAPATPAESIYLRSHVFLYRRVPCGITLLLLLRIKGRVDDRLTSYLLTSRLGRRERNDL